MSKPLRDRVDDWEESMKRMEAVMRDNIAAQHDVIRKLDVHIEGSKVRAEAQLERCASHMQRLSALEEEQQDTRRQIKHGIIGLIFSGIAAAFAVIWALISKGKTP